MLDWVVDWKSITDCVGEGNVVGDELGALFATRNKFVVVFCRGCPLDQIARSNLNTRGEFLDVHESHCTARIQLEAVDSRWSVRVRVVSSVSCRWRISRPNS